LSDSAFLGIWAAGAGAEVVVADVVADEGAGDGEGGILGVAEEVIAIVVEDGMVEDATDVCTGEGFVSV
jgi:hypothetical protein